MKLSVLCYLLCSIELQILTTFCEGNPSPPLIIRLSQSIYNIIYTILPPATNRATIDLLSQNVTLETNNDTGIWQKPDNTNTTNSRIDFPIFTANFAGLYRYYITNQNGHQVLGIQIYISVSGSSFAEETSSGAYEVLSGNNIFYTEKVLVCATNDTSQRIEWTYRVTQDDDPSNISNFANWNSTSGLSRLGIGATEQGYYKCEIQTGGTSYSSALLIQDITIVATNGMSIVYTKFIDPYNIQLLCTTTDSSIPLNNIRWNVSTPNDNNNENPVVLRNLNNENYILNCNGGTSGPSFNVNLLIQGPPIITLSGTEFTTFVNTADIRVLTQDVTIQANLMGMWYKPDGSLSSDNPITYSVFTANLAGLYTFNVSSWEGNQVVAISVTLSATGSNFAEKLSPGDYKLLSGNNIFYASKTLVCVTNDTSQEIEWTYQATQDGTAVSKTTDASFDTITGISELPIITTEQGYYTCDNLFGGTSYTAAIFNPDITIVATSDFHNYIRGIDPTNIQLLCNPEDTAVDLSSIKLEYSGTQYNNPLIFNEAGSINGFVKCLYGSSAQISLILIIREPSLTLTYTGYSMQYNTLSPSIIPIAIPLFSNDVKLTIGNIVTGEWNLPRSSIRGIRIAIPIFTLTSTGRYTYNSTQTWDGMEREVFRLDISPTGNPFAIMESVSEYTPQSNNPIFYTDTILVCLTDYTTQVMWFYRERTQALRQAITSPNTDTNGISTHMADLTKPGFYSCEGLNYASAYIYTAGVFDKVNTRVAIEGGSYSYTIGIDSEEAELLCDLNDSSVDLNTVEWFRKDVLVNPLDFSENIHLLARGTTEIKCYASAITDIRLTANLTIQDQPVIKVGYLEETTSFTLSQSNPIHIPLLTNSTVISSNLINGMWRFNYANGTTEYGDNIEYRVNLFTANNIGIYQYVFSNFYDGEEIIEVTLSGTGSGLGMESNDEITRVKNNTIFYQDTLTLVAASNRRQIEASDIVWTRQDAIADTLLVNISSATIDSILSISRLNLDTLSNGYYTVLIKVNNFITEQYVVGVFKTENIYDTRRINTISYTPGVDSIDLQILCIPENISVLANIRWKFGENLFFPNPVKLEEISDELSPFNDVMMVCTDITEDGINYGRIQVLIDRSATITLSYSDRISVATGNNNIFEIEVFTQNVQLECNRDLCMWAEIDSFGISTVVGMNRIYIIPNITIETNRIYVLMTQDNTGVFVPMVRIQITPIGTSFQRLINNGSEYIYEALTNNSIIMREGNISLVCVTSYVYASEQDIKWYYQETGLSDSIPIGGEFYNTTGLSVLKIGKQGFYICNVLDQNQRKVTYSIGIVEYSIDIREIPFTDLQSSKEINLVAGQQLELFYQNESIPIQSIRWGIGMGPGDGSSFLMEYLNPVSISKVFNGFGSGAYSLYCFYRQSPITIIGNLTLYLRDTASLTIQYGQVTYTFSDERNINFPETEYIGIPITAKNVNITCSFPSCVGRVIKDRKPITPLNILSLRIENTGVYSLKRTTLYGVEYTTALLYLNVTGFLDQSITSINSSLINETSVYIFWKLQNKLPHNAQETFNITYQQLGDIPFNAGVTMDLFYTITNLSAGNNYTIWVELSYAYTYRTSNVSIQIIIPEIIGAHHGTVYIAVVIVPILLVILLLCCCSSIILYLIRKKIQSLKMLQSIKQSKYKYMPPTIDNPIFNPEFRESSQVIEPSSHNYMTIDETSIVPLEIENPYYSNLARNPAIPRDYEIMKQTTTKEYIILGENMPYESHTPMFPIQKEIKFLTKAIPSKEFPAAYKQYVDSGIGQDSFFKKEFDLLNEDTEHQNTNKIVPFDENRVILNSQSIVSDYINASWMGNYQFIATIHPTKETLQSFLQMIYQTEASMVIMLATRREKAKIKSGISNRVPYWSKEVGGSLECNPFVSSLISYTETTAFVKQEISLKNTTEGKDHSFTHCISSIWNEDSTVDEMSFAIMLLNRIIKQKQDFPNAPIILHCDNGISKTGIVLSLFNSVNELNYRKTVNIFNVVKNLRKQRMQTIPSLACYTTCFSLMNEYCSIHL